MEARACCGYDAAADGQGTLGAEGCVCGAVAMGGGCPVTAGRGYGCCVRMAERCSTWLCSASIRVRVFVRDWTLVLDGECGC